MKLNSKLYSVELTASDIVGLIPERTWMDIEKKILKEANDMYGVDFTNIDYWDSEGHFDFGVSN